MDRDEKYIIYCQAKGNRLKKITVSGNQPFENFGNYQKVQPVTKIAITRACQNVLISILSVRP